MKQYCRYCVHCCNCDCGIYCCKKEKEYSDNYAKTINRCKEFKFCELDVFDTTHKYNPRKNKINKNQLSLFDIEVEH